MTDRVRQFMDHHRRLLKCDLDSEEADAIRDEMDKPWYDLTPEEQAEARRLMAKGDEGC